MAAVTFTGCAGCGACLLTCPTHAIRPDGGALYAREDLCTACGECVEVCPVDAIDLKIVTTSGKLWPHAARDTTTSGKL